MIRLARQTCDGITILIIHRNNSKLILSTDIQVRNYMGNLFPAPLISGGRESVGPACN
jgi:hypothetical protein